MAKIMTKQVEFGLPDGVPDAFTDRLGQRFSELISDLALDPKPEPEYRRSDGASGLTLSIDGQPVALELPARRITSPTSDRTAEAAAEGVVRSLFRHRWKLLASALGMHKVPSRAVLKHVAVGGLTMPQLIALHEAERSDDVKLAFLAAEKHPPSVTLLLPNAEVDPTEDRSWLKEAAETVAAYYGMPVPVPDLTLDLWLGPGQFRLRIGSVRSGVQPEPWNGSTRNYQLQRVLRRHASELFDVASLLTLISDPARVPTDRIRAALAKVTLPEMTWALRDLLKTGIGLVDPLQICDAVTQPAVELKTLGQDVLALPGVLVLPPKASHPETPDLILRLRARLVPAHLLRWIVAEGGGRTSPRPTWLGEATLARLRDRDTPPRWTVRLAEAIAANISGPLDLLLTPAELGAPLRELLTDLLPDLLVVSRQELPQSTKPILRNVIDIGAEP
jgi:hypothetical protein